MGGSGGGSFQSDRSPDELRAEVERSLQQAQVDAEVNQLLNEELARINSRDVALVNRRLDEIKDALGDRVADFDRLLFGGSVAKHTFVDGLSDVDSLVVLKADALESDTPQALIDTFERALRQHLDMGEIEKIRKGFAVTVVYKDGSEIQLLPAVERASGLSISDKEGSGWSFIRPRAFEERLSAVNRQQDGRLIPTVKLAKAIVDGLPKEERPGGYHMEALAVEAFGDYRGPRNNKAMLTHFFQSAAERIRRPLADATGQSERIDEVFGPAESPARQRVSAALRRVASRMDTAMTVEAWRHMLG